MAAPQRATEPSSSELVSSPAPQPRVETPIAHLDNATPRAVIHPKDLPPITRLDPSNSGNIRADQKYQQQQNKLIAKQTQERQNLQQKQESQRRPNANQAQTQQLDQRHSQQTQQLSQKHQAQKQSLQARQPQAKPEKTK
jgi:hypothetical protein